MPRGDVQVLRLAAAYAEAAARRKCYHWIKENVNKSESYCMVIKLIRGIRKAIDWISLIWIGLD